MMKRVLFCLFAAAVLTGCATKLGYPEDTVPMPAEVTVLYDLLHEQPLIDNTLDTVLSSVWAGSYKKRVTQQLDELDLPFLYDNVGYALESVISDFSKIFTLAETPSRVKTSWNVPKKSPKKYSGYDFSQEENRVGTRYVLIYQITDYGYRVSEQANGAFVNCVFMLVDTETNLALWKTRREVFKKIPFSIKGPHGSVTSEMLMEFYPMLFEQSIRAVCEDLRG